MTRGHMMVPMTQSRPERTPARCTFKGCPVRYTTPGPDHPCADHGADQWSVTRAAEELGIDLAPGDRAHDGADTTRSA